MSREMDPGVVACGVDAGGTVMYFGHANAVRLVKPELAPAIAATIDHLVEHGMTNDEGF